MKNYTKLKIQSSKITLCLLVAIYFTSCGNLTTEKARNTTESINQIIEKNGSLLLSQPLINSISIGVYKDGKSYTRHFGELDKGKGNKPTDKTIYEIASVSKSFTGTLVAQAILDKKLNLEDDIRNYLSGSYSNLEYQNKPITIKHLITHTSGLPRFLPTSINALFDTIDENLPFRIYDVNKKYSKTEFLTDLQSITIDILPGTEYRYSNADTELMAHILEEVYRLSFDQLLQKYICEIAEMKNTKIHLSEEELNLLANGYGETNKIVPHFSNTLWGAGGGIKSTTSDLMNYIKFQLDTNNESAKESHKSLYSDNAIQIGYLWPIENDTENGVFYNIHGGAYGTQNFLMIVPKHKLGISIITNQSGPETQEQLSNTLNNLLAELSGK